MANKITIDIELCKGCGLCVTVCPKECIAISKNSNKKGYFPAEAVKAGCTACGLCALVCPEAIIGVFRDSNIVAVEQNKKVKPSLAKEET